ncbi:MAG: hypothetical protein SGJ18_05085 [Pseudomonadota bacterium]|nr:hypothetical protein [Pseudomonadota bacterium]
MRLYILGYSKSFLWLCLSLYLASCSKLQFSQDPNSFALRMPDGVRIMEPAPYTVDRVGVLVKGTCKEKLPVTIEGLGSGILFNSKLSCEDGNFETFITFSDGEGLKNVVAKQRNLETNEWAQDDRNFIKDTVAPTVLIATPALNSEVMATVNITGTCEAGLVVDLFLTGRGSLGSVNCINSVFTMPIQLAGSDGIKNIVAQQIDLAGNIGNDNRNIIKDSVAPRVVISTPSAGSITRMGTRITGTCETGYSVAIGGGGVNAITSAACTNGQFSSDVTYSNGDGSKQVSVSQTDRAGNLGQDSRSFVRDSTAPLIAITSPVNGLVTRGPVQLAGTCESGLNVSVSGSALSQITSVACTSGQFSYNFTAASGDGAKQILVSQTDVAGNSGTDQRTIQVDGTAPRVAITAPAANSSTVSGVTLIGTCETGLNVMVTGSGLLSATNGPCSNGGFSIPATFSNGDGTKSMTVTQTDGAGNSGSDSRSFIRDSSAPNIAITAPAVNTEAQNGLRLQGTCESGVAVNISGGVAQNSTTTCSNSLFALDIIFSSGDGTKTIVASQTDSVGNQSSDQRNFIKDTVAPIVTITAPAANSWVGDQMTLTGTCETGLNVVVTGTGISQAATASCNVGQFSQLLNLSNGDGIKSVTATQTDRAGNSGSASRTVSRDSTAPRIVITAPAANSSVTTSVGLQGTCEIGLGITLSGAGLVSPSTGLCNNGNFDIAVTLTANDGSKNVIVSQTDPAGNIGSDNRSFLRDTGAPVVRITSPAAGTAARTGVTLLGTCEVGIPVNISGSGVNAPTTATCTNSQFSAALIFSSGDGAKDVLVTQTDSAGNSGSDTRQFNRDNTAPVIAITLPNANAFVQAQENISGTCESGLQVTLSGSGLATSLNTACAAASFSALVTFSNGDGTKSVTASQTDSVGNTGTNSRSFVRDANGPNITIDTPAVNTVAQTGLTCGGACENGFIVNISGAGIASPLTATCANSRYSAAIIFSNGDGVKNVVASQTDQSGNSSSSNRNFIRDSVAPSIAITAPAAGTLARVGVTLVGTCESGLPVAISGAGVSAQSSVPCTNSQFSSAITFSNGDGSKDVVATQTDTAGNSASDSRQFVRDNTAPIIAITSPNANAFVQAQENILGTCESGLQVALSGAGLAAAVNTSCASGNFSALVSFSSGDGTKVVSAAQTDSAGNTGASSRNFLRDANGPNITIDTPVANTIAQIGLTIGGACETGLTVNISGGGVLNTSTTACSASRYSAAISFSNGDGIKNVVVAQTDAAGNSGSANRDFVRDSSAPRIAITAPNAGTVGRTGLTISGTCETGVQVTISGTGVNAQSTTSCSNGQFSSAITFSNGDGSKDVVAMQTDASGNSASDNRQFIKDNTAPLIAITSPAANAIVLAQATIQGTCESGLQVDLSGSGLSAPVSTACVGGGFSSQVNFTSGDGAKLVTAMQTDSVGNTGSASRTFNRDTTAPLLTIDTPAVNTVAQNGLTVGGACENGLTVGISGVGVAVASTTTCAAARYSSAIIFSNGDGIKNIVVTQTDAANNSNSANRDFIRDATAPNVAISSPADGASLGSNFTLQGTCETGINVVISGAVSASTTTPCGGGQFSVALIASSGDGQKTVTASQTDAVGNRGSDSKTYNVDGSGPVVRITSPAANSVWQSGVTLAGTCETGLNVMVFGSGANATQNVSCSGGNFSANVTFSLGEGPKEIRVGQTDAAGNVGSDSRTFIKDVTAPTLTFTAPAEMAVVRTVGVTVNGTCETNLVVHLVGSGLASPLDVNCVGGRFTGNVNLSTGDGEKNIIAHQTDAAGNTGSAVRNLLLDRAPPIIAITSPAADSFHLNGLTLQGTCESNLTVNISGAGVNATSTTLCSAGQFSAAVTFSNGDGVKNIIASQVDPAGNIGSANRNFNRQSTVPVVRITAPPAGTRGQNGLTLQGTCENGLSVSLGGAGISAATTATCNGGQFSQAIVFSAGDGVKNIIASQTNAVGNVGSDQRDFVRGVIDGFEVFNIATANGKVDILFVDDNSSSMEVEQRELGRRFPSLISGLQSVDWQIGITNTDCSTGPFGICGSLLSLTGADGKILTAATPNAAQVFGNTIYRPETDGCQARGDCPSSNEQALLASMTAMDKRTSDNAGFIRNDSDLAIVVLSDEDEKSNAPPSATTTAQAQAHFKNIWPSGKKLSVYGIIIQPGDSACLNSQVSQGGFAFYGTRVAEWSQLTGGITGSICSTDYSSVVEQIGRQVNTVVNSVELARTPIASSVNVVFTPNQTITWTVQGNRVLFSQPPAAGTRIEVWYSHQ